MRRGHQNHVHRRILIEHVLEECEAIHSGEFAVGENNPAATQTGSLERFQRIDGANRCEFGSPTVSRVTAI
jgi:hypothetical protein